MSDRKIASTRSDLCPALTVGALLTALVVSDPALAQWQVGLQAGATASAVTGDFVADRAPALGGSFAVDLEYWPGEAWVVDIDAGLVQRGATDMEIGASVVDVRLTYAEVPVTVGRAFVIGDGWRIGPYAGFAVGWLQGCGVRSEDEYHYGECSKATPAGAPNRIDASAPLGFSVRHRYVGGSRLSVDLRYSPSLRPVLGTGSRNARSHVVQLLFGFTLPLGDPGSAEAGGPP